VGGAAQPAVRAEVNPTLLNKLGVGLDTVRNALNAANANAPKGQVSEGRWTFELYLSTDTDQLFTADQYRPLIVAYNNGAPVRLGDVADVEDSVSDGATRARQRQARRSDHRLPATGSQHHRDGGPGAGADAVSAVLDFSGNRA
jgi:multidrug efflux pump subunit AcrB